MKKTWNLLLLILICYLGWKFFDWAFVRAVWQPDPQACRAASGACWGFIVEKHRLIAFGTYPYEEHWRPAIASLLLVALWVATAARGAGGSFRCGSPGSSPSAS
jgi:general L-amino acid transport system permease protein